MNREFYEPRIFDNQGFPIPKKEVEYKKLTLGISILSINANTIYFLKQCKNIEYLLENNIYDSVSIYLIDEYDTEYGGFNNKTFTKKNIKHIGTFLSFFKLQTSNIGLGATELVLEDILISHINLNTVKKGKLQEDVFLILDDIPHSKNFPYNVKELDFRVLLNMYMDYNITMTWNLRNWLEYNSSVLKEYGVDLLNFFGHSSFLTFLEQKTKYKFPSLKECIYNSSKYVEILIPEEQDLKSFFEKNKILVPKIPILLRLEENSKSKNAISIDSNKYIEIKGTALPTKKYLSANHYYILLPVESQIRLI